ncbi:unnamed protein product [Lampetra planeri]
MEEETTAGAPGDGAATPEASYKGRANPADPAARPRGGNPGEVLQSTRDGDWHPGGLCGATATGPLCRAREPPGFPHRTAPHHPPHISTHPHAFPPPPIELEGKVT